jgi:hypothetical protein
MHAGVSQERNIQHPADLLPIVLAAPDLTYDFAVMLHVPAIRFAKPSDETRASGALDECRFDLERAIFRACFDAVFAHGNHRLT